VSKHNRVQLVPDPPAVPPAIDPPAVPPAIDQSILEAEIVARIQAEIASLPPTLQASLATTLAPIMPHITVLGSGKATKKQVVLDLLRDRANYPNGVTLDEIASHPSMIAIDADVRVNRTTSQLWLSKIGVPVTRIKIGKVSRYMADPVASATGTTGK